MNKWTSDSGGGVSLSMGTLLGNMERGFLTGDLEGNIKRDISRET